MKKLLTLGLVLFLTGCATPIMKKQSACEEQFSKFAEVVSCTKDTFMADPMARTKDPKVKLYFLKADLLVEKVKTGEISELEARTEWQNIYVELGGRVNAEAAAAAAAYNASRPRQTNCRMVGNYMQCNSY